MGFKFDTSTRLSVAIAISLSFFLVEIAIGFRTRSIALIADAFHYLNDLIGFVVALVAILLAEKEDGQSHKELTYGWQRASLLGAFFNGVFLLALGLSIFLQSVERFIQLEEMQDPKLVVIVGAIGLVLNLTSMLLFHNHGHSHDHGHASDHSAADAQSHSHDHSHEHAHRADVADKELALKEEDIGMSTAYRPSTDHHHQHRHTSSETSSIVSKSHCDFGITGIVLHLLGDAFNNIGVIIVGLLVWKLSSPKRFYADPTISMAISLMILGSSLPLIKRTGHILLQSPPVGVDVLDIQHDLESIPGVTSVHELHVWRLNQQKSLATAHVVVEENMTIEQFSDQVRTMNECLHAYGVHSATVQPEFRRRRPVAAPTANDDDAGRETQTESATTEVKPDAPPTAFEKECQLSCRDGCEKQSCCG